ncbi:MAG: 6-bladed beta-propeller [Longimicrobiales bacterium]|nr:6-bladed beta-propeller [Longimicrobiales bacterium]
MMRAPSRHRPVSLLLAAVVVTACAPDRPETRAVAGVRDTLPDGRVVVRYPALPAGDPLPAAVDLRIGVVEGPAEEIFGDVRGVEADRDGTIYVLDHQAAEIRAFDADGRFVRTVASRGEGPGELDTPNGMVLVHDTLLWVQDPGGWRMIGLATDGGEVDRYPMPVLAFGYIWEGTVDRHGRLWKHQVHSTAERVFPPEEGLTEAIVHEYMVVYDPARAEKDSVYLGAVPSRTLIQRNNRGGHTYFPVPFDPRPITTVHADGTIWRTDADTYRIVRIGADGDTTLVIESEVAPPPVTDRDRLEYVEARVARDPEQRRVAERVARLMPPAKPVITSLSTDDEGRLWVGRTRTDDFGPLYDVFSADGTWEGSVELAFDLPASMPIRVRGGRVYTTIQDSLGVPVVVRTHRVFEPS